MANTAAETTEIEMTVVGNSVSEYGTPRPRIVLSFPASMHHRECRVALLQLAAEIEAASLCGEWIVTIGDVFIAGHGRKQARIELELAVGSTSEAEAGLEVLRRAVQEVQQ